MKELKLLSFFIMISLFVFTACVKGDDNPQPPDDSSINYDFGKDVSRKFLGEIVDEIGKPIENVSISIGSTTVQTDKNGVFIINDARIKENFAYIKAKKPGYIDGSRSLVPTSGVNKVKIMMLQAKIIATVASGKESSVDLSNGTKVTFDGNFKKEDGSVYSGSVKVMMQHLDPSDEHIEDKMPGMLLAANTNREANVLETYGMVNVVLQGDKGEKLEISNKAIITMPIAEKQKSYSSRTIPLWHFDDAKGYWVEEGVAKREGDTFVGEVSHFSWWNCDAPFDLIRFCVKVKEPGSQTPVSIARPLANMAVKITPSGEKYGRIAYTNDEGEVCGLVPKNRKLKVEVLDKNICRKLVYYSSLVGPYSQDASLPVSIILKTEKSTLVKGVLSSCDKSVVTNGYIVLKYKDQVQVSKVTNGDFEFNTLYCGLNEKFTLEGFDYDNLQTSSEVSYTFSTPITTIGNLVTCNEIKEYITYRIDDEEPVFIDLDLSAAFVNIDNVNNISVRGYDKYERVFNFFGNFDTVGVYSKYFSINIDQLKIEDSNNESVVCVVSKVGDVGDYIDITLKGRYKDPTGAPHSIEAIMHVKRTDRNYPD